MNLAILPLAITMLAGPQIMSAIIFVTSTRPVRISALLSSFPRKLESTAAGVLHPQTEEIYQITYE